MGGVHIRNELLLRTFVLRIVSVGMCGIQCRCRRGHDAQSRGWGCGGVGYGRIALGRIGLPQQPLNVYTVSLFKH